MFLHGRQQQVLPHSASQKDNHPKAWRLLSITLKHPNMTLNSLTSRSWQKRLRNHPSNSYQPSRQNDHWQGSRGIPSLSVRLSPMHVWEERDSMPTSLKLTINRSRIPKSLSSNQASCSLLVESEIHQRVTPCIACQTSLNRLVQTHSICSVRLIRHATQQLKKTTESTLFRLQQIYASR